MRILLIGADDLRRPTLPELLSPWEVIHIKSVSRGIEVAQEMEVDVIVLATPLSGGHHWLLIIEAIRVRDVKTRLLFLAPFARTCWEDTVRVFDAGADQCLHMPWHADELKATLKALLRMRNPKSHLLTAGILSIDTHRTKVSVGEKECKLTPREYRLLIYLCERLGRFCSRQEIIESVWNESERERSTIPVFMSRLRRKLGSEKFIETQYSKGYQLVALDSL
jgi:DNA-binding response OmpR family regulator